MDNHQLIQFLNQLLSNYFVLYVKLHRYHWLIRGKQFFILHEKFEEMYEMFHEDIDVLAERILMIQGIPLATMAKYLDEKTLVEARADNQESEMIAHLKDDYIQLISEIRDRGIRIAEKLGDEPTLDMLVGMQGKLEKYVWMLEAYQGDK